MTIKELKAVIADLPDDLIVRYNYDTGHSYPELRHAYVASLPDWHFPAEVALILDQDPRDVRDIPVAEKEFAFNGQVDRKSD